jgi:hypothetical protein
MKKNFVQTVNSKFVNWGSLVQIFDSQGSFMGFVSTSVEPLYGPQGKYLAFSIYHLPFAAHSYVVYIVYYKFWIFLIFMNALFKTIILDLTIVGFDLFPGMTVTSDGYVAIADSGNHCIKLYKYA